MDKAEPLTEDKSIRFAAIDFAFRVLSGTNVPDDGRVSGLLEAASTIETYLNTGKTPEKAKSHGELQ